MPPKQRIATPQTVPGTPFSAAKSKSSNDAQSILQGVWDRYVEKTTQRTKLLDSFMLFLVAVGALQFLYVVLVGNFVSHPASAWTLSSTVHMQPCMSSDLLSAFQCFSVRIQRLRRSIRPHSLPPHPDQP